MSITSALVFPLPHFRCILESDVLCLLANVMAVPLSTVFDDFEVDCGRVEKVFLDLGFFIVRLPVLISFVFSGGHLVFLRIVKLLVVVTLVLSLDIRSLLFLFVSLFKVFKVLVLSPVSFLVSMVLPSGLGLESGFLFLFLSLDFGVFRGQRVSSCVGSTGSIV